MAETTLQLGFVPKNRGEYQSTPVTRYYKDNVVQYNGSSYIADPVGWSESDPTATYVTIPPTDASGNLNAGWKVFASGNNTFTTGEKVDNVGIDDEPTAGSKNLVKSGGVYSQISQLDQKVNGWEFSINGCIQSDGTVTSTTGYKRTNFIKVNEGDEFYYLGRIGGTNICVAGYSSESTSDFEMEIVPSGKYLSAIKFNIPSGISHIVACSATDVPYILINIPSFYQNIVSEFEKTAFPFLGYLNYNGVLVSSSSYLTTDFIQVSKGDCIIFSGAPGGSISAEYPRIAGYNQNKEYVSNLLDGHIVEGKDYVIEILDGVSFVRAVSLSTAPFYLYKSSSFYYLKQKLQLDEKEIFSKFGDSLFTYKRLINLDGTFYNNNLGKTTDFIEVNQGDIYYYCGSLSAGYLAVAGYDVNHNFVSQLLIGGEYSTKIKKIVIPSGVNYIIAGSRATDKPIISPYYLFELVYINQQKIFEFDSYFPRIVDATEQFGIIFNNNGYILTNGGFVVSPDYRRTDLIQVDQGDVYYYIGGMGNIATCVAAYDAQGGFVSALIEGGSTYTKMQEVVIPSGVKYIAACSRLSNSHSLIKKSDLFAYVLYLETQINNVGYLKNEYYGKTVNWLGDSIVAEQDFDEMVSSYFGMTENDYGVNGSSIAKDENNTRNSMAIRYSNMTDNADVIIVSGGTNDYQYSVTPFGQLGDSTVDTFYGALDVLCRGLITKYPTKIIFFTTPIKRNQETTTTHRELDTAQDVQNSLGKYLYDYATAIKEVCAKYSIPVLDLYSESMLNPNMSAQAIYFDKAGTHPDDRGRAIMARRVRGFMKQLC